MAAPGATPRARHNPHGPAGLREAADAWLHANLGTLSWWATGVGRSWTGDR